MAMRTNFEQFTRKSPVTVMFRGLIENGFSDERINGIFRAHAQNQWERELLFSTAVSLLGLVVTGQQRSINAAYNAHKEEISVSVQALYNKLKSTEPEIARALVREPAGRLAEILNEMNPNRPGPNPQLLEGYRAKILDGKHLDATQNRLKVTRAINAAPLPGKLLVVLDPQLSLAIDVFPCEDGWTQERKILPEVYETIEGGDLWIADRNFCTTETLFTMVEKEAFFLIRQHGTNLCGKRLEGKRKLVGPCETGVVYEQVMEIDDPDAKEDEAKNMTVRRITVELDKPTRNGEKEIHLVTNLPTEEGAIKLAMLYLERWQIENLFGELSQSFEGEINTLCYPRAALLAFCVALMTYNVQSVLKAALREAHADEVEFHDLSTYYLSAEIEAIYGGMMLVLPPEFWEEKFSVQTPKEMAEFLLETAGNVSRIGQFKKTTRGERKKPPKRTGGNPGGHVSTARLLAGRKKAKSNSS